MFDSIAFWIGKRKKAEEQPSSSESGVPQEKACGRKDEEEASAKPEQPERHSERTSFETKACPFCRNGVLAFVQHTVATGGKFDGTHIRLQCEFCGACGPLASTHESAVDKWNAWEQDSDQMLWKSQRVYQRSLPRRRTKPSASAAGRMKRRTRF